MDHDPLVRRLQALELPVPRTLVPRVLAARVEQSRRRPRLARRLLATAMALIALAGGNLGASYLSPRYAQVLADTPGLGEITGPLLQQAGLSPSDAEALSIDATAGGYTIHLFGAAADGVRTTLFLSVKRNNGTPVLKIKQGDSVVTPEVTLPFDATLTDQFGHVYHRAPAGGEPVVFFQPLAEPAATLGARLTLHIPQLEVITSSSEVRLVDPSRPLPAAPPATKTANVSIAGPWDLSFTLTDSGSHDLALPPAVSIADTTYTFTAVRQTSSILEVSWRISGGAVTRAWEVGQRLAPGTAVSPSARDEQWQSYQEIATARLLDENGAEVSPVYGAGHDVLQDGKPVSFVDDAWYPVTPHASYRFQVSVQATGDQVRDIRVP